ncbi:MAG: hypothetical protein BWY65_00827 [Firmicutes bacterium ADurb.Bin373]|nr:MAG: hypothetical protein BWY65_00827 [Firmicutes bacterium ADurb.Bin373]
MKRKLIYFIAFLVILGVVAIPAICMNKVFSSDRQGQQAASIDKNAGAQGSAANQNQPAAGSDQASPGSAKGLPDTEAKQGDPAPQQQAAASGAASPESAAPAPADDAATVTAPAVSPESGCQVWIAVVGKNGEQLYQAGQVLLKKDNKWGINALGALEATGLPYTTMPTWPDFVYSISGQANSGVSGWMYSVNGDVPMHMADKHPVKAGDRVIWWYSNSMEQPQPRWDELVQ